MPKQPSDDTRYKIDVPLDASQIEDFDPKCTIRVAAFAGDKILGAANAKLDASGKGSASLSLSELASGLEVVVGPGDAADEELVGLQTIRAAVPLRELRENGSVQLPDIVIGSYYWYWWLHWCRTFTIRGVVLCPNGEPVPGATVCAYDVDWWWWWFSSQKLDCATTDINGAFEIQFRWCCGWWPWWWWRLRHWVLEPDLVRRIDPVLLQDPRLPSLGDPQPQPSLEVFDRILSGDDAVSGLGLAVTPENVVSLRQPLVEVLPRTPELEQLRIWPWYPWYPWWDCTPDVIFQVTHDCPQPGTVIVNETFADARWDIDTDSRVVLVANDSACCEQRPLGCLEGSCLALTSACGDTVDTIGGNISASPTPIGYQNPGAIGPKADRPYAGLVTIDGTMDCMEDVDYYEFEYTTTPANPASWASVPGLAAGAFTRRYLQFTPLGVSPVTFGTTPISGHDVYETLQHYQDNHPPPDWGADRIWIQNRNRMMNWLTANNFADGTYYLRARGYDLVGGNLVDKGILEICDNPNQDNFIVLTIDNRTVGLGPLDSNGHTCGAGSVHLCTTEPDVDFLSVKIVHADATETDVSACGEYTIQSTDVFQVDFAAHDPDGHLAKYVLNLTWGESNIKNLLSLGGTLSPSPLAPAWAPAPLPTAVGPTYGNVLIADPTVRPQWHGGAVRLTIDPATAAFEETCCYQLELWARKRTIVSCDHDLDHWNRAEYSFMIVAP